MAGIVEITPDSLQISIKFSASFDNAPTTQQVKYVPKNADGTVHDCTGYTSANLTLDAPSVNNTPPPSTAMSVGTADTTGIILWLSSGQATSLCDLPAGNYSGSIVIENGSSDVGMAAAGTVTLTQIG